MAREGDPAGARARTSAWLPWLLWALAAALLTGYLALYAAGVAEAVPSSAVDLLEDLVGPLAFLAFATFGALIIRLHPRHPIGWIFCLAGLAELTERLSAAYALYTLVVVPGRLPGGLAAAWVQNWAWGVYSGLLSTLLVLLFPDGRLVSARWRPVAWLSVAAIALLVLGAAFHTGPLYNFAGLSHLRNPLGLAVLDGPLGDVGGLFGLLGGLGFALLLICMLAAAVSLRLRLRRARGRERQQLRWFAYFGGLLAGLFVLQGLVRHMLGISSPEFEAVFRPAYVGATLGLPVATGLAILRHRLYDIDLLIRRTLVYGALTAALGLAYWGSVLLLQQILLPLTQSSELAVIGSTLGVASLFRPARGRIQAVVDRRFYRRTYDAQRTLGAFSARLRHEVDLDGMTADLLGVVRETVQPAHASLWLRPPAGRPARSSAGTRSS